MKAAFTGDFRERRLPLETLISELTAWYDKFYETLIETGYYKMLIEGLKNTLTITAGALAIGVILGTVIALAKYFCDGVPALKPVVFLCDTYVTVIRGIPVVVLLLIFYYVIMKSTDSGVTVGIVTFGINSGAYMAELIRGGINSVDIGQMEAGRSLGMSKLQAMYKVIMPQALRYILPAIGNEFIALLKETSVAGYVAVRDVTKAGDLIRNITYDALNPLMVVALTYLVLVMILSQLLKTFERRLNRLDNN